MFIPQWRANTGKFQSAKDRCCSRCTGVTITVYSDRNTVDVVITSADKKNYFDTVSKYHEHCRFVSF